MCTEVVPVVTMLAIASGSDGHHNVGHIICKGVFIVFTKRVLGMGGVSTHFVLFLRLLPTAVPLSNSINTKFHFFIPSL